jgi:hypothetical protein
MSNINKLLGQINMSLDFFDKYLKRIGCKIINKELINDDYDNLIYEYNFTIIDNIGNEYIIYGYFHEMPYDDYEPHYSKFKIVKPFN